MAGQGLSSADFRARAAVATLSKAPNGHAPTDPVDDARALRRQLIADKIVDQAVTETSTDQLKAENDQLKARIENEQLREQRDGHGASDKYLELIMGDMNRLRDQLEHTQQALNESQIAQYQERLGMLQAEIERVSAAQPPPSNPLEIAAQTITSAKQLMEIVHPEPEHPARLPMPDPAIEAWGKNKEFEHQRWLAERADRHQEKLEEIRQQGEIAREKLEIERRSAQVRDRFYDQTLPKVLEWLGPIATKITGAVSDGVFNPAAAGAAPTAMANAAPELQPGVVAEKCQQCGNTIYFRPEYGGLICPYCGTEYRFQGSPMAPDGPMAGPPENPGYDGTPMGEQTQSRDLRDMGIR